MNLHDSEKMAGLLEAGGFTAGEEKDADLIVLNTCSIRQKAEQKFLSELGRLRALKKKRPSLRVVAAGCIAQQMGAELFKRTPPVDYVIGPENIHAIGGIAKEGGRAPKIAGGRAPSVGENPALAEMELPALRAEKGRAWVNIMYGCNNFCSYCIVPYTRGRERYRPEGNILGEIKSLAGEGWKEVTLLGQNVNSYPDFPGLLEKINALNGLERIRFVTSHPKDFSDELISAMAELPKVCEHIHLPLQSGSTKVLGLMNRRYTYKDYKKKVDKLREKIPGIAITSDIIAGFPGETDKDHEETLKALKYLEFDGVFAFKFSPRPGTLAAGMDGKLPEGVKAERLKEILALQDEITLRKNKRLEGEAVEVMVEGKSETDPDKLTGRTRTNKVVNFKAGNKERKSLKEGSLAPVKIIRAMRHSLEGEDSGGNYHL